MLCGLYRPYASGLRLPEEDEMVFVSENQIHELLVSICDKHVLNGGDISASVLATEALNELDPLQNGTRAEIYTLAHLRLREEFRRLLRKRFEPEENTDIWEQPEIPEMFPNLQKMYPKAHKDDEEPAYRHLEQLTEEDQVWNISQMRSKARALNRHADALEEYFRVRQ